MNEAALSTRANSTKYSALSAPPRTSSIHLKIYILQIKQMIRLTVGFSRDFSLIAFFPNVPQRFN